MHQTNQVIGLFGRVAASYDQAGFLHQIARRLVAHAGVCPGMRVLDVACGTGAALLEAARRTGPDGFTVGVDLAEPMVNKPHAAASLGHCEVACVKHPPRHAVPEVNQRVEDRLEVRTLVAGEQQERLAAKRRLAEPDVAAADVAGEGDRVGPLCWVAVAQLAPAVVGAERARYCIANLRSRSRWVAAFQLPTRAKPSHCLQRVG